MTPEEDARSVMAIMEQAKLTPIESIKKMLQYAAAFIVVIEDRLITLDYSSPEIQQNILQAYSGFALVQKSVEAIKGELEHAIKPRLN